MECHLCPSRESGVCDAEAGLGVVRRGPPPESRKPKPSLSGQGAFWSLQDHLVLVCFGVCIFGGNTLELRVLC